MADNISGLTLLEILVSLLLLSILLLGLDAVNLISLREAKSIWYYDLAELQVKNMQEYLRAGQGRVSYQIVEEWNHQNALLLPVGRGSVDAQQIIINWGNNNISTCDKTVISTIGCVVSPLSKH